MRMIVFYVVAIIICGGIGATCGWWLTRWAGITGTPGALVSIGIALVVAVAAWVLGVAVHDARLRR
jgi:hypothetical protein